jgi:hypothetical protein
MREPTGCDDSLMTSLSVLVRYTQRQETKQMGEFSSSKEPYNGFCSFSVSQSIDYPHKCKFGFKSVLANTLGSLDMLQGHSSTNLSKCLRSYLVS